MEKWKLSINHKDLARLYKNYLYQQDQVLTYYLTSVAVTNYSSFESSDLEFKVRASSDFPNVATSLRTLNDIKALIDGGAYDQLSRSTCFIGLVTNFSNYIDGLKSLLAISQQDVKSFRPRVGSDQLLIRPASLKTVACISEKYDLNSVITRDDAMLWINSTINLRHMFIHNEGLFNASESNQMRPPWSRMKNGEKILLNKNYIDDVFWFLNDHVKDFTLHLDKALVP